MEASELIPQDLGWERNQRIKESIIFWALLGNDLEESIFGGLRIDSSSYLPEKNQRIKESIFFWLFWA